MTKKTLLIIYYFLFSTQVFAQLELEEIFKLIEIGKCYASVPNDTNKLSREYLQILPPKLDTIWTVIDKIYLEDNFSKDEITNEKAIKVKIRPAHFEYQKIIVEKVCVSSKFVQEYSMTFCIREIPAKYLELEKNIVYTDNEKQYRIEKQVVPILKLLEPSTLKIINEEEALKSKYSVYPIFNSKYTEWREIIGCGCGRSIYSIEEIQYSLKNKGYEIEINGLMNAITRKALTDFQKEHNLDEGRLDAATLKLLCPTCGLSPLILNVQRRLIDLGYEVKLNGIIDEMTEKALIDFQNKNGLNIGRLDSATLAKLGVKRF